MKKLKLVFAMILLWSCSPPDNSSDNNSSGTLPEFIQTGNGTTYYVSVSGNDSDDGLSPSTAWKSLDKVNSSMLSFQPGDSILFNSGDSFRGHLEPMAGSETDWIKYSSYGTGEKPQIVGSLSLGDEADWELYSGNVWRTVSFSEISGTGVDIPADVGGLFFNSVDSDGYYTDYGLRQWELSGLTGNKYFYFDHTGSDSSLYLYSSGGNPASVFSGIEASLDIHLVDMNERRYVLFENLHFTRGAGHGFSGSNAHDLVIRGCDFSYMGGAFLNEVSGVIRRYGNGIEFWNDTSHVLVDGNRFWEIFDTAVTNQGHGAPSHQKYIYYINNIIWNCGLASFELWLRESSAEMEHIYFLHNTSVNPGFGWGGSANRDDRNSFHVASFFNASEGDSLVIKNNIFYSSDTPTNSEYHLFFLDENVGGSGYGKYQIDHNLWSMPSPSWALSTSAPPYTDFAEWQSLNGQSVNGVTGDPLFSDFAQDDFSLQSGSPAINTGCVSIRESDFFGYSADGLPDMGAIEY